jgi:RNA-directed DNA polymerase
MLADRIADDLLLPMEMLQYLVRSAPHRYRVYRIPKHSGSGFRTIAQPAREVRMLQYWVMKNIFPELPVHSAATAYCAGKNIRDNCAPHAANPYLLKLDFRNFFPSIKAGDFIQYAAEARHLPFDPPELRMLACILFRRPKGKKEMVLSVGAPSSPYLSNALLYGFDDEMSRYCESRGIVYTRYADDMAFSMQDKAKRLEVLHKVRDVLKQMPFPRLTLNDRKTVFASKAHRRSITGLTLANDGRISLGRERKRQISAQLHHFVNGKLPQEERGKLRGLLSYVKDIEPAFFTRMAEKYGREKIAGI